MFSFNYLVTVVLACSIATVSSRVLPFVLLKKMNLPLKVLEFLQFVPIVIMAALWFSSLFTPRIGHLPKPNLDYMIASFPTVLSAIISKNLFVVVFVGMISIALLRYFG